MADRVREKVETRRGFFHGHRNQTGVSGMCLGWCSAASARTLATKVRRATLSSVWRGHDRFRRELPCLANSDHRLRSKPIRAAKPVMTTVEPLGRQTERSSLEKTTCSPGGVRPLETHIALVKLGILSGIDLHLLRPALSSLPPAGHILSYCRISVVASPRAENFYPGREPPVDMT